MTVLRGERPVLKDYLIQSLQESGWTDVVRLMCREEINKANGLISVDSLVDKVTPKARQKIPDEIKTEMIAKIKKCLTQMDANECWV